MNYEFLKKLSSDLFLNVFLIAVIVSLFSNMCKCPISGFKFIPIILNISITQLLTNCVNQHVRLLLTRVMHSAIPDCITVLPFPANSSK